MCGALPHSQLLHSKFLRFRLSLQCDDAEVAELSDGNFSKIRRIPQYLAETICRTQRPFSRENGWISKPPLLHTNRRG